ncbi:MAG: efflux RND transporter permease subunit [Bacteroidota bacterium]
MNITNFSIKNYQFTLVMSVMAAAIGIVTLLTMPRAEDPQIYPPEFNVVVVYPGASPEDMQQLIAKPIENKLYELSDVDDLFTTIEDGLAVVKVGFTYSVNVDDKYQEVVREVNSLTQSLPSGIMRLDIIKVDPSDVNILQIGLISESMDYGSLEDHADDLVEKLEQVSSLKNIDIAGTSPQVVNVNLDLERMAKDRIPMDAVLGNIQSEDVNIPGGVITAGNKSYNIKSSGKYVDLEDIKETVVYEYQGALVYLKDIAEVTFRNQGASHITRVNGYRGLLITAALKEGSNISASQEQYLPIIEEFQKTLPSNVELTLIFDQGDNVAKRLGDLRFDFTLAIFLVLITLLPLGIRASLIVMLAIPLSLAIGLVGLNYFGISLNQLSIVGLVVALGLLVDDSIVVVENIERWLREGYNRNEAAIKATQQIAIPVVGTTATLVIAFLPLVFLPEASGEFIRGLPLAVICSVIASMVVALTIVPFLASRILNAHVGADGNLAMRLLQRAIQATYSKVVKWSLQNVWKTLFMALLLFAGSMMIFPIIGFKLFPDSEKPIFLIDVQMPDQTSIQRADEIASMLEDSLATESLIKFFVTNVGKGNPRIYYNVPQKKEKSDFAQFFIQLNEGTKPKEKKTLIDKLRTRLASFPYASVEIEDFVQGPPITSPIELRLFGDDEEKLTRVSKDIAAMLEAIPGSVYVDNDMDLPKTDIKVDIDRDRARGLGLLTADIDRTIRLAISGLEVGTYTDSEDEDYDIVLTTHDEDYPGLEVLESVYINNGAGIPIAMDQFAALSFETSPKSIKRLNKKRFATVTSNTVSGVLANDVLDQLMPQLETYDWPSGFYYRLGGEAESEGDAFGGNFIVVVLLSTFLFLAVLILQFKTFTGTIIVLSVIPLGVVGGVTMLWLTGNPMSFVAIVGFIGLAGIEVKNSILLVDFTNQLRLEGMPLQDAIERAGDLRFLPVLLTAITAIGGLMPLAISANPLISPLALVLIGGLISSTLLSRIVTPVLYKLIPPSVSND